MAIGLLVRAGHDAEVARLRVDRPQPPVRARMQPGDVVADRPDLPAGHRGRRYQHGEVRLAAGGRERAGEVVRLALRVLDADDQHVLGEPALVARLPARDAQRVALLAEQRIAAVARAEALDLERLREMHDEAALGVELADRVQALHEASVARNPRECRGAHARHELHVGGDVGAVGDLDAAARVGRVDRAHAIRDDVHRAPAHAALEQRVHLAARLGRAPSSGCSGRRRRVARCRRRSGARRARRPRDSSGAGSSPGSDSAFSFEQVAVRHASARISSRYSALRAVAPVDLVRPGACGDLENPVSEGFRVRAWARPSGQVRLPSRPRWIGSGSINRRPAEWGLKLTLKHAETH